MKSENLRDFYASPLGIKVAALLRDKMESLWHFLAEDATRNRRILLYLGYGEPFAHKARALSVIPEFLPEFLGESPWRDDTDKNISCRAHSKYLPFDDMAIDNVIAVHALELSADPAAMLGEIWRILNSQGRLLLIVPARRGFWARCEKTPFGHGQPFSILQLRRLLKDSGFSPLAKQTALYWPPFYARLGFLESVLPYVAPALAGVFLLDCRKILHTPPEARAIQRRKIFAPAYGGAAA